VAVGNSRKISPEKHFLRIAGRFFLLLPFPNPQIFSALNSTTMADPVHIEVVGLKTSECSPFPCDEERTCGLSGCYPAGTLNDAFGELQNVLHKTYGNRVECKLTLIDEGAPAPIRTIIEQEFPPIPMILVNGRVTRIGRIALDRIMKEIEKEL